MRIEPVGHSGHNLRMTHWDISGNILTVDLTWAEWDELVAAANRLRVRVDA